MVDIPSVKEIEKALQALQPYVLRTPVWRTHAVRMLNIVGKKTELLFKLELFQRTGSFKPRGAILSLLQLDKKQLKQGVIAASAGNHAVAVSYAAHAVGTHAKVVMPKTASQIRQQRCKDYNAEVILVDRLAAAFHKMREIEKTEQRYALHPFEGKFITLGTATLGFEVMQQLRHIDAIVVPVGGGGLLSGVAAASKQLSPETLVFGVEPEGASAMSLSLSSGHVEQLDSVNTVADSLAVPYTKPYSFSVCQQFVDGVVTVNDGEIIKAIHLLFDELKLAVEPACAVALAGLCGPLKKQLSGKRVLVMLSGTNIDPSLFCKYMRLPL